MKVGYIGLGAMGSALARRLVSDYELVVWDLNSKAVDEFVKLGATTVQSPAEMARQCEVVILCLPRSSNVRQVTLGSDGLAEGFSAGKVVVDQTSGIPRETCDIAEQLAKLGVAMIDAPVAGGVPSALAGTITIMASGPDEAYEKAFPVLRAITPKVYRTSNRIGDGQAVKLVNNSMNAGYRMATLEIVALGRKLGLSLRAMTDALAQSWACNYTVRVLLPAIVEERPSNFFALSLMVKDLNQTILLGMELEVPMPIANIARGLMQIGLNTFGENAQLDDLPRFMASISGGQIADGVDTGVSGNSKAIDYGQIDHAQLTQLIVNTVAACNRLVTYENAALGVKFGLELGPMSAIINDGSGWSKEAERIFPALAGDEKTTQVTLGQMLGDLDLLTQLGFSCGVPLLITNEVGSIFRAQANEAGTDANLDALASRYASMAKIRFGGV